MALATHVICVLVAIGLLIPAPAIAQEQGAREVADYQFWSGTVLEVTDASVTVRRSSNNSEDRKFTINGDTKVEGKLVAEARVTVAYLETENGTIAKRIIVRDK
jgi:hypothetical protein